MDHSNHFFLCGYIIVTVKPVYKIFSTNIKKIVSKVSCRDGSPLSQDEPEFEDSLIDECHNYLIDLEDK